MVMKPSRKLVEDPVFQSFTVKFSSGLEPAASVEMIDHADIGKIKLGRVNGATLRSFRVDG